jgi:hypothetical protein
MDSNALSILAPKFGDHLHKKLRHDLHWFNVAFTAPEAISLD